MQKKIVKNPNDGSRAYDYAVYLLSLHLRTTGELRQKLHDKGYSEAATSSTLDELVSQRYLDDQRYAEVFLDNLKKYKNFGYYGIKKKLMEKKLSSEIIENVLAEGLPVEEEIKIGKRLLGREGSSENENVAQASGLLYAVYDESRSKLKQKLAQKLKSRGFRGDVIAKLLF